MVDAAAAQEHIFSVEAEAVGGRERQRAQSDALGQGVQGVPLAILDADDGVVEHRLLGAPGAGIGERQTEVDVLLATGGKLAIAGRSAGNDAAVGVDEVNADRPFGGRAVLVVKACRDGERSRGQTVADGQSLVIQRQEGIPFVDVNGRRALQPDVTVDAAASVPT